MDGIRTDISTAAREAIKPISQSPVEAGTPANGGFSEKLASLVGKTDSLITNAEKAATDLAAGSGDSVDTIIAMSKADLALRHVVTLRNRALEAYQEIMRLPL